MFMVRSRYDFRTLPKMGSARLRLARDELAGRATVRLLVRQADEVLPGQAAPNPTRGQRLRRAGRALKPRLGAPSNQNW
jgi:hypothetical protein